MSLSHAHKAFALASLKRLLEGYPDKEPHPATYGIDYFTAAAIQVTVQRLFEEDVLARTYAFHEARARHGSFHRAKSVDHPFVAGPVLQFGPLESFLTRRTCLFSNSLDSASL
jgi:hypothetical protein